MSLVALGALAAASSSTSAQGPYGAPLQASYPAAARAENTQAYYTATDHPATPAGQQAYLSGSNSQGVQQTGYCEGCADGGCNCGQCCGQCGGQCCGCGGYGCAGGGCCNYGGFNGCMPMGYGGTDPPVGYDLMNDVGIEGNLADQRGPHYFDLRAESVWLRRDSTFAKDIDFTAFNVGNTVVLNSKDIELDDQFGFRIIGRYDIGPLSVVEFGYMGIYDWEDSATVVDNTNNLYSLFSRTEPGVGQFGVDPVGVNVANGPNPESERASQHSISMSSDLQTAEISYRRYWLGYFPSVSGTLLAGFRYTKLDEHFVFATQGSEPSAANPNGPLAAMNYDEDIVNHLAGFQVGADAWVGLCQGLRLGSEGKVGLYNNHYTLANRITTTPLGTTPPTLFEEFKGNHAALIAEGSVDVVADILPSVSLRAGYEVLFLNSLVLAGENFNETSPYGNQSARVPFVNNDGEMFYHGAHAGIEYIW